MLVPRALAFALICLACAPGRIEASPQETGSTGGEAEDPDDAEDTEDSAEASDEGPDDGPGGCGDAQGLFAWLDVCEPGDRCDAIECPGGLECLGGRCIEPPPGGSCAGVELESFELPFEFQPSQTAPVLADIDAVAGDELISIGADGRIEVARAGELVTSWTNVAADQLTALQYDGGPLDLVAASDFVLILAGDAEAQFTLAPGQLSFPGAFRSPIVVDPDGDGDDDLLVWAEDRLDTQFHRNDGGMLVYVDTLDVDARRGRAVDFDLDGQIDDVLFASYPSPTALLGQAGEFTLAGPLPEPERGPNLEYGVGRPLAADIDADGFVDVVTPIADAFGAVGGRVWWGMPGPTFDLPRDQVLPSSPLGSGGPGVAGLVDLDGEPPLELLIRTESVIGYARPDLDDHRPFGCITNLVEGQFLVDPLVGDLDADGRPELVVRNLDTLEIYTLVAP